MNEVSFMMKRMALELSHFSAYWLLYWLLRTSPNSFSLENFITTNVIVNIRARGLKGNKPT